MIDIKTIPPGRWGYECSDGQCGAEDCWRCNPELPKTKEELISTSNGLEGEA